MKIEDLYCPACDGDGFYYVDDPKPQGYNRDVGYLEEKKQTCDICKGTGVKENNSVEV
jgi:RecJ-like exonuclease